MRKGRRNQEDNLEKPCNLHPGIARGPGRVQRNGRTEEADSPGRETEKRKESKGKWRQKRRKETLGGGKGRRKRINKRKKKEQVLDC